MAPRQRYEQLDALRGLAALSVVVIHAISIVRKVPPAIDYTPLHVLWAGHEAVIFFFVLSGFVLTVPFLSGDRIEYGPFAVKRLLRIYLPYLVAITVSLLLATWTTRRASLGTWFATKWTTVPTTDAWLDHLLLVGNFDTSPYNPVIWSLVHEVRISLVFPLIVWMVRRYRWSTCLGVAAAFSAVHAVNMHFGWVRSLGWRNSLMESVHFSAMFIVGALMARYRAEIVAWTRRWTARQVGVACIGAVLVYSYARAVRIVPSEAMNVVAEWGVLAAVVVIIAAALAREGFATQLQRPVLIFNGKISYSLYLWHTVVLFAAFHGLAGRVPVWAIYAISAVGIAAVATASYAWLEKTSIEWGRAVGKRWAARAAPTVDQQPT